MSDKSTQKRLFYAIGNLENSINQAIKKKDEALSHVEELVMMNSSLREEIKKLTKLNNTLAEKVRDLSAQNKAPEQENLLDSSSSYDVDISINQLKSVLLRKN